MKKALLLLSFAGLILSGCHDQDHGDKGNDKDHKPNEHCVEIHKYHKPPLGSADSSYCNYIPADTANVMIKSYLNSIHYQQEDTDLHALIYDADSLRAYLSDKRVVKVKFMFAHTLDYINGGGLNKYAGYQSGALTFVIAGYDIGGNYVFYYYPRTTCPMVKDHCYPCPNTCPPNGTASSDTLVFPPTSGGGR